MTFWRKNWYYIGGILFVLLAFIMGLWGGYRLGTIQIILVFSWMGMLMHQFEEYAFPGGFPIISNMAGLSFMLMHVFNVAVGMTFSGGFIDLLLFGILPGNAKTCGASRLS